jgi:hypothetical protein
VIVIIIHSFICNIYYNNLTIVIYGKSEEDKTFVHANCLDDAIQVNESGLTLEKNI